MTRRIIPYASSALLDPAVLEAGEIVYDTTNQVPRFGDGATPGGRFASDLTLARDGSAASPSQAFRAEPTSGLFRESSGQIGFGILGTKRMTINSVGVGVGGVPSDTRLTVKTAANENVHGLDIACSADQTNPANQLIAFRLHGYYDGTKMAVDGVGTGILAAWTQGRNPGARPDKASSYVGEEDFFDFKRTTPTGIGGNLGTGQNRLRFLDKKCNEIRFGSDAAEWDKSFGSAPDRWLGQSGASKGGYVGWHDASDAFVLGSIEDGVAFKYIDVACAALRPVTDNAMSIGAASLRPSEIFAATGTINTSDEREKVWRGAPTKAEIAAAQEIVDELGFYQWKDAIEGHGKAEAKKEGKGKKGARFHFGPRAQRVWAIMAKHKLVDPIDGDGVSGKPGKTPYAFLCFDSWEAQREPVMVEVEVIEPIKIADQRPTGVLDAQGREVMKDEPVFENGPVKRMVQKRAENGRKLVRTVRKAGTRFGVRPDQLALFLIAGQAARQADLEKRLAKLEKAG